MYDGVKWDLTCGEEASVTIERFSLIAIVYTNTLRFFLIPKHLHEFNSIYSECALYSTYICATDIYQTKPNQNALNRLRIMSDEHKMIREKKLHLKEKTRRQKSHLKLSKAIKHIENQYICMNMS